MTRQVMIRQIIAVGMIFLLSGCLTSNVSVPTHYILHPEKKADVEVLRRGVSLVIERPSIASGLNNDRIALVKNNGLELDYFAAARWNGQLDKIVQDFIIESFEHKYDIIDSDSTSQHQKANYTIVTKIRDFQAEYEGDADMPPVVKVTLVSSILQLPNKNQVSRVIKTHEGRVSTNSMQDIVHGFESLLIETVRDIEIEIASKI